MLRLEFGSRRLRASWWMTALTLVAVLLFVQLGRWQWHRADDKRHLSEAFAAGAGPATALGARSSASLPRYVTVTVEGHYDGAHQFLLDNMSDGGQTGYEVLTPLGLADGRLLLVNRGWLALPEGRRDRLPDIGLGPAASVSISGRLDEFPVTALQSGTAMPAADAPWPRRTSFPTAAQLGAALGQPVEARQLLLAPGEALGFRRQWRSAAAAFGPERHLSYAIQWWGFAALALFLYLFMNLERNRP